MCPMLIPNRQQSDLEQVAELSVPPIATVHRFSSRIVSCSDDSSVCTEESSSDTMKVVSLISNPDSTKKRRSSVNSSSSETKRPRLVVEHHYHDHLHDPPVFRVHHGDPVRRISLGTVNDEEFDDGCNLKEKRTRRRRRSCSTDEEHSHNSPDISTCSPIVSNAHSTFPEKLHHMLEQADEEGLSNVVTWQPHGRCFLVKQKKEFVETIIPRFFQQSKLTSFQRQLNLYGFTRLTAGRDRGAYYHELFLRGRPDLCNNMYRTRVKGSGIKAASSPDTEPNFYVMEYCKAKGPTTESDIVGQHVTDDEREQEDYEEGYEGKRNVLEHRTPAVSSPVLSRNPSDTPVRLLCNIEPMVVESTRPLEEMSRMPFRSQNAWDEDMPPLACSQLDCMLARAESCNDSCLPTFCSSEQEVSIGDSCDLLPSSCDTSSEESRMLATISDLPPFEEPCTGDVVFFEGRKFFYLDHTDLELGLEFI